MKDKIIKYRNIDAYPDISKHSMDKSIFLTPSTLLTFDTNALLDLYKIHCNSDIQKIFHSLKKEILCNVFLTNQVVSEFLDSNEGAYKDAISELSNYQKNEIENLYISIKDSIDQNIQTDIFTRDQVNLLDELTDYVDVQLQKVADTYTPDVRELLENFKESDFILDNLSCIFNGKVSPELSQKEVDHMQEKANFRYSKQIPPGYEDMKKKKIGKNRIDGTVYYKMYGDVFLWFQLIDYASNLENLETIILISNETKKDWKKNNQIREELVIEIKETVNANFHLISLDKFISMIVKNDQ